MNTRLRCAWKVWAAGCAALAVLPGLSPLAAVEFTSLFNGRDLTGWIETEHANAFVVEDGAIVLKNPHNYPNWLRSEREYENFNLTFEYMMTGWTEAGVYLHAPRYGDPVESGVKLHLRHDRLAEGARSNGAIYDVAAPLAFASKGPREWNLVDIHMDWPVLHVKVNGVLIQDLNMALSDQLRSRARRGYIGLEDLNCRLSFRNIRIETLPDTDRPWTPLVNGRDLAGWTSQGGGNWKVDAGAIVGSDGDGFLFTERSFSAFEFRMYFRTSRHANGGLLYRRGATNGGGYEIQVYNVPTATNPTGSIYGQVPASSLACRDDEWCQLRLVSDGAYSAVWVNGRKVAESSGLKVPDLGRLGLQMHSLGRIEYLDPEIRPLR